MEKVLNANKERTKKREIEKNKNKEEWKKHGQTGKETDKERKKEKVKGQNCKYYALTFVQDNEHNEMEIAKGKTFSHISFMTIPV